MSNPDTFVLFALQVFSFVLTALLTFTLIQAQIALREISKTSAQSSEVLARVKAMAAAADIATGNAQTAVEHAETAVEEATHRYERDHPPS